MQRQAGRRSRKYDDASQVKLVTEFDNAGFKRVFLEAAEKILRV